MFTRNYYNTRFMISSNLFINSYSDYYDDMYNTIININGAQCKLEEGYGRKAGGNSDISVPTGLTTLLKKNKNELFADTSPRSSNPSSSGTIGLFFGNGTKESIINDCHLSGEIFTTYTSSYTDHGYTYDDEGVSHSITYTLTNTGTEDFTISEIGLIGYGFVKHYNYSRYLAQHFIIERTFLETPITIPANGGVGQVTYTLRMNYPTE